MANDTVPMDAMFNACHEVLDKILVPTHYTALTQAALKFLGINIQSVDYQRQIEDVREKLPKHKKYGAFYTGAPLCLVGLNYWFENRQLYLLNADINRPIRIPGNINSGITGAFEGLMRFPHMLQKQQKAPLESRAFGCARGLVIEQHVVNWFFCQWPTLILPPDNEKEWEAACDHDFKINTGRSIVLIDVWGPDKSGKYTKPLRKKSTHFHLQCRICENGVQWESVIPGKLYDKGAILPEVGISPRRLIVWLNCIKDNLPYENIKQFA